MGSGPGGAAINILVLERQEEARQSRHTIASSAAAGAVGDGADDDEAFLSEEDSSDDDGSEDEQIGSQVGSRWYKLKLMFLALGALVSALEISSFLFTTFIEPQGTHMLGINQPPPPFQAVRQ